MLSSKFVHCEEAMTMPRDTAPTVLAVDACAECGRTKLGHARPMAARCCYYCGGHRVVRQAQWRYVAALWPRPAWDVLEAVLTAREFLEVHALWDTPPCRVPPSGGPN